MPNQKLPLFGGIIAPVHNGNVDIYAPVTAIPLTIFTPPDKALTPRGVQSFYELHLWLKPSKSGINEFYVLYAEDDDNPGVYYTIWAGRRDVAFLDIPGGAAIKILDGYPVRGNMTVYLSVNQDSEQGADLYPAGAQAWGYYYHTGQGTQIESARRFVGEPSPDADGITEGIPMILAAEEKRVLHVFEDNRIDEMSLAFNLVDNAQAGAGAFATLFFEDENGADLIAGHEVSLRMVSSVGNYFRDPTSIYSIYQLPLGGGISPFSPALPNPYQISVQNVGILNGDAGSMAVHGYFTRR